MKKLFSFLGVFVFLFGLIVDVLVAGKGPPFEPPGPPPVVPPVPVPEPSTLILLGTGLAAGAAYTLLRNRKNK